MTWAYRPILTKIQEQDLTKYSIGIETCQASSIPSGEIK